MESAFGVDHGLISKKGPLAAAMTIKTAKLKPVVGRGLPGKHAKAMEPLKSGASVGRRRLGGGTHSSGLFAR